ncbi:MAG: hypothetical protein WCT51_04230 [Candidatus Shapirobacteria bacterium]|jgi:hypothetical protein
MKKINIWDNDEKIGELFFDDKNKIVEIHFEKNKNEEYVEIIKIMVDRMIKRGYSELIFDEKNIRIKNADENVVLAIKQELFMNLGLIFIK